MQGEIGVESVEGEGSCFWFTVELELADPSVETTAHRPSLTGKRVHIGSSLTSIRHLLKTEVQRRGAEHIVESSDPMTTLRQLSTQFENGTATDLVLLSVEQYSAELASLLTQMYLRDQSQLVSIDGGTASVANKTSLSLALPIRQGEIQTVLERAITNCYAPVHSHLQPAEATPRKPEATGFVSATTDTQGASQANAKHTMDRGKGTTLDGLRVLVVEDNQINRLVVCKLLDLFGCQSDCVEDGKAGVEAVERGDYDIVLMDCQMPIMDGRNATRSIRKLPDPLKCDIVIIALTANAMAGDREACLASGMNDFLPKPVAKDVLREALIRWAPTTGSERSPAAHRLHKPLRLPPGSR